MNATEMREAKITMESEIKRATHEAINRFYDKTGLTPESIDITMVRVEKLGLSPFYVLSGVETTVKL